MGSKERMKSDGAEYDLESFFFGAKVTFSIFFKGVLLFNFGECTPPHHISFSSFPRSPEEVARDTSGTKRGSGGQLAD